jgi:hypothetical protein
MKGDGLLIAALAVAVLVLCISLARAYVFSEVSTRVCGDCGSRGANYRLDYGRDLCPTCESARDETRTQ